MATNLLFLLSLIFTPFSFSRAMTTITAVTRDQIACTMCSSCQNPCQPVYSPPPPPVSVPSPPPPTSGSNCPPPPSPPISGSGSGSGGGGGGVYYFPPPPPGQPSINYPPINPGGFPTPPPPNPIVPYFPYYYYNPPPPSAGSRPSSFQILPIIASLGSIIIFFLQFL